MSRCRHSFIAGVLGLLLPPAVLAQSGHPLPVPGPRLQIIRTGDDGWNNAEKLPLPKVQKRGEDNAGSDEPDQKDGKDNALPMPRKVPTGSPTVQAGYDLNALIALTLQHNPRLAQAAYAIDAARGRATQAGLYPNPVLSVTADEVADRTGRPGIINAPQISQEIVRGGKLELSRAAADREVDQAALSLVSLRYERFASVRQAYFELLTLQRRLEILDGLLALADQSVQASEKLRKAGQAARLDLVQLEVEREQFRAEQEATRREMPAAYARLMAAVGVRELPFHPVIGSLCLPELSYDFNRAKERLIAHHPDIRSAQVGVERAKLLLERAKVEPIPNVTVGAGYVYQSQNRSNDFNIGISLPVPIWNKNQGNIHAAQAQLGEAVQQVGRVEFELTERLATAFRTYSSARQRAYRYQKSILSRAREGYQLSLKGYRAGQFDYLRVLEAQRAYGRADLEAVRSLGEMWRAAGELSGLLLEDEWPMPCPPEPATQAGPETPRR